MLRAPFTLCVEVAGQGALTHSEDSGTEALNTGKQCRQCRGNAGPKETGLHVSPLVQEKLVSAQTS